ncbi:protein Spindly-like [Sinocyclocheilus anshuiensis]|uniref:protein Spindly-like n=1 Tax=Sinocyclocheilus anshuiensis TaxID=1608454 RepID=UPI0007B9EB61|nr:PREDICTED: protein Spindly-like [Sinocyclocheilus anshuiensis]
MAILQVDRAHFHQGDLQAFSVSEECLVFRPAYSHVVLRPRLGYVPKAMPTRSVASSWALMSDLEDEIKVLRRKVQEGEEALQRAGQYGLQLLDDKMDLHNKLEEQRIEMSNVIEALEQEKYSLQRDVELKARMLESLRSEFDLVRNQQKHQMEQQQTLLERSHALELSDLKNKLEKMKTDLEEAQLAEKQMRHKLDQQSLQYNKE